MKKTLFLLVVSFTFCAALSAQVSRLKADEMVFKRMSKEAQYFEVYGKGDLQTEITISTTVGETIELDYACWVYYVVNTDAGRYLIVNKSNGNVLEVKSKDMAIPENFENWRLVKNPADVENATVYAGTKWKFVGIVDALSGSITELEPKDCLDCYSLSFYDDNRAYVSLISGWLEIDLRYLMSTSSNYSRCIAYFEDNPEIFEGDDMDAVPYWCELHSSTSYTVTDDELKFFSGEDKSRYLLFKRNRKDESTGALIGTKWKLVGSVDVETGEITAYVTKDFEEFDCERCNQPPFNFDLKNCTPLPDCEECYTLIFGSDTTFTGRMFVNDIGGIYHINDTTGEFRGGFTSTLVLDVCEYVIDWKTKFPTIRYFSLQENQLKLYYNDQKNYYLFKRKER